jgi:hypothetical protein
MKLRNSVVAAPLLVMVLFMIWTVGYLLRESRRDQAAVETVANASVTSGLGTADEKHSGVNPIFRGNALNPGLQGAAPVPDRTVPEPERAVPPAPAAAEAQVVSPVIPVPSGPVRPPNAALPESLRTEHPAANPERDPWDPAFQRLLTWIPMGGQEEVQLRALWRAHEDGRRAIERGHTPEGWPKDLSAESYLLRLDTELELGVMKLLSAEKRTEFLMQRYQRR